MLKNADVRITTTVVAYTSFCDGQVTRFSSLRTSLRNRRQRSNRPPAASLTVSNRPVSSATFLIPRNGRPGGNRTPNPRFWRPVLCQLSYGLRNCGLLRLLVIRMLPAEAAVLRKLQPLSRLLLVFRRAVVAPLAHRAGERDDVSHNASLLDDLRHRARADGAAPLADGEARAFFERDR